MQPPQPTRLQCPLSHSAKSSDIGNRRMLAQNIFDQLGREFDELREGSQTAMKLHFGAADRFQIAGDRSGIIGSCNTAHIAIGANQPHATIAEWRPDYRID